MGLVCSVECLFSFQFTPVPVPILFGEQRYVVNNLPCYVEQSGWEARDSNLRPRLGCKSDALTTTPPCHTYYQLALDIIWFFDVIDPIEKGSHEPVLCWLEIIRFFETSIYWGSAMLLVVGGTRQAYQNSHYRPMRVIQVRIGYPQKLIIYCLCCLL